MKFEIAARTDIGSRSEQQDRIKVLEKHGRVLVALADGAGGHADGAQAAQTFIDVSETQFDQLGERGQALDETSLFDWLKATILTAHKKISTSGKSSARSHSTCVLLLLDDSTAAWAHVGDSRLYGFKHGQLAFRTLDHSVIEVLKMKGRISDDEVRNHPDQNKLLSSIGGKVEPDIDVDSRQLEIGDAFLVASDGVWARVGQHAMESAVCAASLVDSTKSMIDQAKENAGEKCDNVTVAIVRVVGP